MRLLQIILILFIILPQGLCAQENPELNYKSTTVDTFFGVRVPDPYRWLESLNSDSTAAWLNMQRAITAKEKKKFGTNYSTFFGDLSNERIRFYNEVKHGPYYFSLRSYYDEPAFLCYRESLTGEDEIAFNPALYPMYQNYGLAGYAVSDGAKYLAIALSKAGSDWCEIRVKRILSDALFDDKIEWVKFSSIVWWGEGFFYSRFKVPPVDAKHTAANTGQQLFYHKLGTLQESDSLIYANDEAADYVFNFYMTASRHFLIIHSKTADEDTSFVAYKDLSKGLQSELKVFASSRTGHHIYFDVLDDKNGKFITFTNWQAPKGKVVMLDKDSVNRISPFIAEGKLELGKVRLFGGKLLCVYESLDTSYAVVYNYDGKPWRKLMFNTCTTISGFHAEPDDSEVVFWENSFYSAPAAYVFNMHQGKVVYSDKSAIENSKKSEYTTTLVWYRSKDGTLVPMYLTYRKGLNLKGNNPVLLYGYGGYGISLSPGYSAVAKQFCSYGGIYAVALIRGGGENGVNWHKDGRLLKKQNSFNDFIAAAEFLISEGYTSKEKLAVKGGSNGGLLIGAMLTQRPDLFSAAVANVGVYDMLRYQHFTGGRFWTDEYGVSDDSIEFKNLLSYSPLHNVKQGAAYPATLLTTAANDDRVPPLHTFKFLATLQERSAGSEPHILYFEKDGGHSGSQKYDKLAGEEAFELSFIFEHLKMKRRDNN